MPAAWVIVANCTPRSRHGRERAPVENEAGRRRFERDRRSGDGVHVSHNASGVERCEYWIGRPCRARPSQMVSGAPSNSQCDEARMMVQAADPRAERTEDQLVAWVHRRRQRPIFGPRPEIARRRTAPPKSG